MVEKRIESGRVENVRIENGRTENGLTALIEDFDGAIAQAVENPLLFAGSPLLEIIERRCAVLAAPGAPTSPNGQGKSVAPIEATARLEALAWQVRARAGRLQRLLDSASHFYTTCFSVSQCEGLAYGVQGEWGAVENPNHLTVDC